MKFELKTENENYSKSISQFFGIAFFLTLIIIFFDVALKLAIISKNHKKKASHVWGRVMGNLIFKPISKKMQPPIRSAKNVLLIHYM